MKRRSDFGKPHSDERKAAVSAGMRAFWARRGPALAARRAFLSFNFDACQLCGEEAGRDNLAVVLWPTPASNGGYVSRWSVGRARACAACVERGGPEPADQPLVVRVPAKASAPVTRRVYKPGARPTFPVKAA